MKRAVVAILAAIGGLVILGMLFLVALSLAVLGPTPVPDRVVLELDLDRGLAETVPQDPLALALERRRLTTRELVEGLENAVGDERVQGLLVRGGEAPGGWARVEEVRDAVLRFRESGKPTLYFSESFGEFGAGQGTYFLASAFDEVMLQPSGDVGLMPLVAEAPFLREMLERLDVEPRFDARWEYKSATEMFTRRGFSESSREATEALLESILTTVVEGIAEGRGIATDSVRTLVRQGPFAAADARSAGLVDELGYVDQARDRIEERAGEEGAERLAIGSYVERGGRAWDTGTRVALVHGEGLIHRGTSGWDPLTGSASLGASTVAGHLRTAIDDDRVRAILFRVESPGGSYVASDVVRRELLRARQAGKPVVVSMGTVAASGGYLISTDATRIVAHPTTLTGSIGVAGGKLVTGELFNRYGIEWDRIEVGGENTFYSPVRDFSEEEWNRFQDQLDRIYEEFTSYVAEGRGMAPAEIDRAARGRVWSGRDALELGLVDALGGFHVALEQVRELLDLEPDAPLQVASYPAERTLFEILMDEGWRVGVRTALLGETRSPGTELLESVRPLLVRLRALGLGGYEGPVRMPPLEVPSP